MNLSDDHIKQFAKAYLIFATLNFIWLALTYQLLSNLQPVFFSNTLDATAFIFRLTGIQQAILNHKWVQISLDFCFLVLPFLICIFAYYHRSLMFWTALLTILSNSFFAIFYTSISYMTIGMFQAWTLIPIVLCCKTYKGFYFNLHSTRIIILFILVSAAIWKIYRGGIFNDSEMSSILLKQHTNYLISDPENAYSKFIFFFIRNISYSYVVYLLGFIAELVFIIGFFTTKWDRFLMIILILFALFDYVFMQINLFCWMPFCLCFWFSKYPYQIKNN